MSAYIRYHSSDDMPSDVMEPTAVVIRPDGSVDVYGYVGIVDQRQEPSGLAAHFAPDEVEALIRAAADLIDLYPGGGWLSSRQIELAGQAAEWAQVYRARGSRS